MIERENRYYITSLGSNAEALAKAVCSHWSVENSLHWVLDMTFKEGDLRICRRLAAENMTIIGIRLLSVRDFDALALGMPY